MTIPSTAIADPSLRLVHQLLNAMCTTQCAAAISALRDQIGAYLADPDTRDGRAEDMVLSAVGLAAAVLRAKVAERGHTPTEWTVIAPHGAHHHDPDAYNTAEGALNAVLNWQDTRTWLRAATAAQTRDATVDLVCEATWLARIVIANSAGRAPR